MDIKTADRLAKLRKEHSLSQEQLAEKIGVSRQAVSKWERAEATPDIDNLISLSRVYGISLDEMLGLNGPETPKNSSETKRENEQIKDEVNISFKGGVNVKDARTGDTVHVGPDGINIKGNAAGEAKKEMLSRNESGKGESIFFSSVTSLLCIVAYLCTGFLIDGAWRVNWLIFFLIPILVSLFEAVKKKKPSVFAYPVLVTAVFLGLGMFMSLWHPAWVIFLTVPIYYIIADGVKPDSESSDSED